MDNRSYSDGFCDAIDLMTEWADKTKAQLVVANYDDLGDGHTKTELNSMKRSELLALIMEQKMENEQ